MTPTDRPKFAAALAGLAELYDRSCSPQLAEFYWRSLRDAELEDVLSAIDAHVRDPDRGRFFPKPADVLHALTGSAADRAALAWGEVLRLARDSAHARSDDPATEAAVRDLGGWVRIGRADARETSFLGREFERLHAIHARRGTTLALGAPRSQQELVHLAEQDVEDARP